MADASTMTSQLFELWRRQLEESTAAWARMMSQAPAPAAVDPTAFWRPLLTQGLEHWARLFAQTPITPDFSTQWKQFVDQWIDMWSRALGQAMNTEGYAQMMGRSLDQWLVTQGPAKRAAEQAIDQALEVLNVASRRQLTSVAKQVVELEERLERIEDGISAILKRLDSHKEPT